MDVKILGGTGLHSSELRAVKRMETELRDSWSAFAGLVVTDDRGSMEIDTLIITHDRLLLVELKEWNGRIESRDGQWYQNGKPRGKSPYAIKREHARRVVTLLKAELEHKLGYFLHVEAHVVLCGTATPDNLVPSEKMYVHSLDDFLRIKTQDGYAELTQNLGNCFFEKTRKPRPNSAQCLGIIKEFFAGPRVKAQRMKLGGYTADSDPWYKHRHSIYSEYKAENDETPTIKGLMRRWDFSKLGTEYALQETWAEIALREARIGRYLRDVSSKAEPYLLRLATQISPDDVTDDLTELYELKRSCARLDSILTKDVAAWSKEERIDKVRALLAPFAELHALGIAHRDIDPHNLWYAAEQQSILVSGFAAAFFSERGTVSHFRSLLQSSDIKIPEDVLNTAGEISDPFAIDVFLLGVVAHRLCFGGSPPSLVDGIPEWQPPSDDVFEGTLNPWFEKALAWDSSGRFPSASTMLSEFNGATSSTPKLDNDVDQIIAEFVSSDFIKRDLNSFQLMQQFPLSKLHGEPKIAGNRMRYISELHDGQIALVKVWTTVNISPGQPGACRRLYQFKKRITSVDSGALPTPDVIYFGVMELGGLIVATKYVDGQRWDEFMGSNPLSLEDKLAISMALVSAVQEFHEKGVAHGDLQPQNILLCPGEQGWKVQLVDVLDYGADSQPYNTEYGPQNPASTDAEGRDRYGLYKIVEELFSEEIPPKLQEEVSRARGINNGIPISIEPLVQAIRSPWPQVPVNNPSESAEEPPLIIQWGSRDFPGDLLMLEPIDGGFYFNCKWGRETSTPAGKTQALACYITSYTASLQVNIDVEKRTVESIRLKREIPFSDLVSAGQRSMARITRPLGVRQGTLESNGRHLLDLIFDQEPVIDLIAERFSSETDDVLGSDDESFEGFEPAPTAPHVIWRALNQSEGDLRDAVVIESEDYRISASGALLYPYSTESGADLAFDDEAETVVSLRGSDRGPMGAVVLDETSPSTLAIRFFNDSVRHQIKRGVVVLLESVRNKSSRDIRTRALERVLNNHSVIPGLAQYFDYTSKPGMERLMEDLKEDTYRSLYDEPGYIATETQLATFRKLLSIGPVGVLQGPPGTGKTTFISRFIHYLFSHGGCRNILLVGQSHTAVDNVALKARTLSAQKGFSIDVVRLGREAQIAEQMLSSHADALQRQIRNKFHREYEIRIGALSNRIDVPENLLRQLARVFRAVKPLVTSLEHHRRILDGSKGKHIESGSSKNSLSDRIADVEDRLSNVISSILGHCPADLFEENKIIDRVFSELAAREGINNPVGISQVQKLLSVGQEWLDVLRSGEAGYERFLIRTKQLVCGTLVGVGSKHLDLENTQFDWVIVDEAGRAQASELMVALQCGKRVLLVGDHKQLPPFYHKSHLRLAARSLGVSERVFQESDFERAFKATEGVTLDVQYRMAEPIGDLVSECFYSKDIGKLSTGRPASPGWYSSLPHPWNRSVTWVDSTSEEGERSHGKGRYFNRTEVNAVLALLRRLVSEDVVSRLGSTVTDEQPFPIGIITMYKAQKEELELEISRAEWMGSARSFLKIDTVDSYQGQENKIVILSLVRDNPGRLQGFLGDASRINVAISRAQERLMIVGSTRMWSQGNSDSALGAVISHVLDRVNRNDENYQLVPVASLFSPLEGESSDSVPAHCDIEVA